MRLDVIKRWLASNGLDKADKDQFMIDLKERVFSNLEPREIDDKYFEILAKLLEQFETVSETS